MKTSSHWKKIGLFPHHGICVPLFSLRSKKSCGIGEFFDLIPLIDWCKTVGFDCIQLLPLNDTGDDPSPYNPISSCALDPVYISLFSLDNTEALTSDLSDFTSLNHLDRIDRKTVKEKKLKWLESYFFKIFPSLSQNLDYKNFLSQHRWLDSYARFQVLSKENDHQSWQNWTKNPFINEAKKNELEFYYFLQYLCFSQLRKVHSYAQSKKIFLKGDVPILLSPNSADVWIEPNLFRLDFTAGAPPDYYTPDGQNWGFPLFDLAEMRRTHFHWLKQKLAVASLFYDLYRIDHVVGFFRIWAIPLGSLPSEGFFIPKDPSLWQQQGEEILNIMLDASPLLPIAEDLGTIPDEAYASLKKLGICGTKVIRWEVDKKNNYIPYENYEPFSMTTVSTCDCDPLRSWWRNFPHEAKNFAHFKHWVYETDLSKKNLTAILRDAHHTPSYFHINLLEEYLSLFPELIWGGEETGRINIPGTLLTSNWTYKFRPFIEELVTHQGLQEEIKKIISI